MSGFLSLLYNTTVLALMVLTLLIDRGMTYAEAERQGAAPYPDTLESSATLRSSSLQAGVSEAGSDLDIDVREALRVGVLWARAQAHRLLVDAYGVEPMEPQEITAPRSVRPEELPRDNRVGEWAPEQGPRVDPRRINTLPRGLGMEDEPVAERQL